MMSPFQVCMPISEWNQENEHFVVKIMCQFSCLLRSDSLQPHELQHTRLLCPSPTPGAYSNSCPWDCVCERNKKDQLSWFYWWYRDYPGETKCLFGLDGAQDARMSSTAGKHSHNLWRYRLRVLGVLEVLSFCDPLWSRHYFANKGPSSQGYFDWMVMFFQWSCMDVRVGL